MGIEENKKIMKDSADLFFRTTYSVSHFKYRISILVILLLGFIMLLAACNSSPPVASFEFDISSGDAPLNVQFSDTSQGKIKTWVWDFGDGSTSTEQNPSHEYTITGTYSVQLSVTGPGGEDLTTLDNIVTVSPGPLTEIVVIPSQISISVQDTAQLNAKAIDQFGNEISDANLSWESTRPEVTIDSKGLITAGVKAGDYTGLLKTIATRNGQSIESRVDVTITPGPVKAVTIEPTSITLDIGDTHRFTFKATDEFITPLESFLNS